MNPSVEAYSPVLKHKKKTSCSSFSFHSLITVTLVRVTLYTYSCSKDLLCKQHNTQLRARDQWLW